MNSRKTSFSPFFRKLTAVAAAIATAGIASTAYSIDFVWTNGAAPDNNWLTPANWTPAGPPAGGAGNFAIFLGGTTNAAEITSDVADVQDYLFRNDGTAGLRTVNHSAGNANVTGWIRMGNPDGGSLAGPGGIYNLSGTANLSAGRLRLAERADSTSEFNQTGGTLTLRERMNIGLGANADAIFTASAGVVNINTIGGANHNLNVGRGDSNATFTISGTAAITQLAVADPGNGANSWNRFGEGTGTTNFNMSGGSLSLDGRTFFGTGGTGVFVGTQTDGDITVRRGEIVVGDTHGNATYNMSGGTLRTLSDINNGDTGGDITIGQWDNSAGQLNVSGDAVVSASRFLNFANGQAGVPSAGTGTQTGGTVSFAGTVQVSRGDPPVVGPEIYGSFRMSEPQAGTSTYTLSSGTLRQNDVTDTGDGANWNAIGGNGIATFNLSGDGVASFDARTFVGRNSDAAHVSTVNQTGGLFEVRRGDLTLGDGNGHGNYNISGGTVQTTQALVVGQWDNSEGNFDVSGTGTVVVGADLTVGGGREFADDGVTPTPSVGTFAQSGGTVMVGGNLNIANGNPSQTGTYNLSGGTLNMTGGTINRGADDQFIFTGGRLVDAATINFAVAQAGGTLAPGADGLTGTTTINGDYSLSNPATLEISITDGFSSDFLFVNGTLTLGGNLSIVDDPAGLTLGSSYQLVTNDAADPIVGFFANAPGEGAILTSAAGNAFQLSYVAGDGNDISAMVVPEPATGALLLGSMGMFALLRRRRS